MAKRKTRRAAAPRVSVKRAPARSGAVVVVRETAGRIGRRVGRHRASGAEGTGLQKRMQRGAMGGFGVGMVEKHFGAQLPSIPYVGKKGAIALGVYFFKPKQPLLQDIGVAAATLAGYQFGKEGRVDGAVAGDDDDDDGY